eukprot:572746-Rhodomonas_salina.5
METDGDRWRQVETDGDRRRVREGERGNRETGERGKEGTARHERMRSVTGTPLASLSLPEDPSPSCITDEACNNKSRLCLRRHPSMTRLGRSKEPFVDRKVGW